MTDSVIHCGKCGYANSLNDDFCIKCGNSLSKLTIDQKESNFEIERQNAFVNVCPICKNMDQIQKLSTIVSMGIHTTSGLKITTGQTNIEGKQQYYLKENKYIGNSTLSGTANSSSTSSINLTESSNLVKKLAPPQEPIRPKKETTKFEFIHAFLLLVIGFIAFLISGSLLVLIDDHIITIPTGLFKFLCVVAGILAAGYSLKLLINKHIKPLQEKEDKEFSIIESEYKKDALIWEKAIGRWNSMYYCYRDNVVFVPGENETGAPERVIDLCYKY